MPGGYTALHAQIIPFTNPGWDAQKFAIEKSLRPIKNIRIGVSLYGDSTYGEYFSQWLLQTTHQNYGITEFHPLKAIDTSSMRNILSRQKNQGAEFISFFMEPRWNGQLIERKHNIFSFDTENRKFGSDALHESMRQIMKAHQQ